MGSMCVSSCKCWALVWGVHPIAILSALSCNLCGLLIFFDVIVMSSAYAVSFTSVCLIPVAMVLFMLCSAAFV